MEFNEFAKRLEAFQVKVVKTLTMETDEFSEMIYSTDYRRIFLSYNAKNAKIRLIIEVSATIINTGSSPLDQKYYTNLLKNMLDLCNYLLELQKNSFSIDLLSEEGIWYATTELSTTKIENSFFKLLRIEKIA